MDPGEDMAWCREGPLLGLPVGLAMAPPPRGEVDKRAVAEACDQLHGPSIVHSDMIILEQLRLI